ncbi:MAG: hypothetical protein ACOY9Y_15530 [Bacillota bacterium]
MSCLKTCVFLAWNPVEYRLEVSHHPLLDLKYLGHKSNYRRMALLTPFLPLGLALHLLESVSSPGERQGQAFAGLPSHHLLTRIANGLGKHLLAGEGLAKAKHRELVRAGRKLGLAEWPIGDILTWEQAANTALPLEPELDRLRAVIKGRSYFLPELEIALREQGFSSRIPLEDSLQIMHLRGECFRLPGLSLHSGERARCNRCGEENHFEIGQCLDCKTPLCGYCVSCAGMGEAKLCRPLYVMAGLAEEKSRQQPVEFFSATACNPAQKDAAGEFRRFAREQGAGQCLVWSARGTDPLQALFHGIAERLDLGGQVLFATPRRDQVMELAQRIKGVFPTVDVLPGRPANTSEPGQAGVVVAAVPQVISFYRKFSLVIVEESETLLSSGNNLLQRVAERAAAQDGKTVFVTTAPGPDLLGRVKKGLAHLICLPVGVHGYPLPEPQLIIEKSLIMDGLDQMELPESVAQILHRSLEGDLSQVFIFVPFAFLAQRAGEVLRRAVALPPFNHYQGDWVFCSHARDVEREEKKARFARGEFPIFVTTPVAEKPVKLPKANVIVLFAEAEDVYNEGTLIQLAGCAGDGWPPAKVWYVGNRVTKAMNGAVQKIRHLNQEAFRRGYLHPDFYLTMKAEG